MIQRLKIMELVERRRCGTSRESMTNGCEPGPEPGDMVTFLGKKLNGNTISKRRQRLAHERNRNNATAKIKFLALDAACSAAYANREKDYQWLCHNSNAPSMGTEVVRTDPRNFRARSQLARDPSISLALSAC